MSIDKSAATALPMCHVLHLPLNTTLLKGL